MAGRWVHRYPAQIHIDGLQLGRPFSWPEGAIVALAAVADRLLQ